MKVRHAAIVTHSRTHSELAVTHTDQLMCVVAQTIAQFKSHKSEMSAADGAIIANQTVNTPPLHILSPLFTSFCTRRGQKSTLYASFQKKITQRVTLYPSLANSVAGTNDRLDSSLCWLNRSGIKSRRERDDNMFTEVCASLCSPQEQRRCEFGMHGKQPRMRSIKEGFLRNSVPQTRVIVSSPGANETSTWNFKQTKDLIWSRQNSQDTQHGYALTVAKHSICHGEIMLMDSDSIMARSNN
ncbi:hypothetical protein J6590_033618 [Homalodisca vitripennis]|nr:hypothetical protein J6590_033618 [Homalodisca vitripennis]